MSDDVPMFTAAALFLVGLTALVLGILYGKARGQADALESERTRMLTVYSCHVERLESMHEREMRRFVNLRLYGAPDSGGAETTAQAPAPITKPDTATPHAPVSEATIARGAARILEDARAAGRSVSEAEAREAATEMVYGVMVRG